MLASILSHQSLPAKPQSKDNSISDAANGEEFSEHLGAKRNGRPEMEQSDVVETTAPEPQLSPQLPPQFPSQLSPQLPFELSMQIDGVEMDGDFSAIETAEEVVLSSETGSISVELLPELLDSEKIINVLGFSHLMQRQETEMAKPINNEEVLVPSSNVMEEQVVTKIVPPEATQVLNGVEKNIPIIPVQTAATPNGFIRDTKVIREKDAKTSPQVAGNLQTSIEVKPTIEAKNVSVQPDAMFQPKSDLLQEKGSVSDLDLEKTVRSLDVKVNSAPVSADPASAKPSADGNVQTLSQPSQTLVRAIQENSNWTKVMNTSSVQLETTPKIDGTVLQKLDIHLNLSTIGKLDVKLRLHQGELQIQIRTDSEQAFKALSVDQDALANTIKGLGYKVDNIAISGPRPDGGFQMNSNSQAQSQHHSSEHQAHNEHGGQRSDREFLPMKDAENETPIPLSVDQTITSDVDVI